MVRTDQPIPKPILQERIMKIGKEIENEQKMMNRLTLNDYDRKLKALIEGSIQEKINHCQTLRNELNQP